VATIAVLALVAGWLARLEFENERAERERERAERPGREIVLRNQAGDVIGQAPLRPTRVPGQGPEFQVTMVDGTTLFIQLPRPNPNRALANRMEPGQQPMRMPFGFAWMLGLVALAVAIATYPIVRRLTKRLETVQQGVERWGAGDLSTRLSEEGQDEVAFLAERFNNAAERIQALIQSHESLLASQKSLLANASHELRSPLTRIRMGLELMGTASSPASRNEIARNIGELDQLIDEILLASRLDAREADLGSIESVDLIGLAAEECARVQAELDVQSGDGASVLAVQGVSKLLRRAVRNLLENARRHGAGEVTVTLQQAGDSAVVRVCDHGPGVPVDLRERIFEPFYRLPGATERDGGVGLGLSLVKSIATRHGGSVHCENAPGGGACFVLSLPLTPETTQKT